MRLRDITIRTRLYALVTISTVGLAAVLCVSGLALHWYRVDGPVHRELKLMRQLLTDLEPSVLALWRPHLVVKSLPATADPAEITRQLNEVAVYGAGVSRSLRVLERMRSSTRRSRRLSPIATSPPMSTSAWSTTSWPPRCDATRWTAQRRCWRRRSILAMRRISRRMTRSYLSSATTADASNEAASQAAHFWMRLMLVLSSLCVATVGLLGWFTTRSVTASTGKAHRPGSRNGQRGGRSDGQGDHRRQRRAGAACRRDQRDGRQDPDRGSASPRGERPVALDLLGNRGDRQTAGGHGAGAFQRDHGDCGGRAGDLRHQRIAGRRPWRR